MHGLHSRAVHSSNCTVGCVVTSANKNKNEREPEQKTFGSFLDKDKKTSGRDL